MRFKHSATKATNGRRIRHLLVAVLAVCILQTTVGGQVQFQDVPPRLRNQDIIGLTAYFKSDDVKKSVLALQQRMPPAVKDSAFRKAIHRQVPSDFKKLIIGDPGLTEAVRVVVSPVLALYGRTQAYDILVVDSPIPLMMSDSGVVLVVTTGILQAKTDDELLGYVAHEIGHEYFAAYSLQAKGFLDLVKRTGNERFLTAHLTEVLGTVEIECDAFAALTLAYLGYNPLQFILGLEGIASNYPRAQVGFHPPPAETRVVVEAILPIPFLAVNTRRSEALVSLQKVLSRREETEMSQEGRLAIPPE